MSKTLSKNVQGTTGDGAGRSFDTNYSLDLSSEDEDLKAVEQQLALENGLVNAANVAASVACEQKSETMSNTIDNTTTYDVSVSSKSVSEMTDEELKIAQETLKKRETTIGEKTIQNGEIKTTDENGVRLDSIGKEQSKDVEELGGTITGTKDGKIKYEGELGSFTYNPDEWALATKEVEDDASGVTTTIPVLRYIAEDNASKEGDQVWGGNITIPDGLKSLDYSFENNKALETIPKIPDSVESAHAAFKNCTKVTRAAKNAKDNEHDGSEETKKGAAVGGLAGAAAGAVGGFAVGSGFAGVGAIPGTIVGAVVGGLGLGGIGTGVGAAVGNEDGKTKDGKGGTWNMPDGLKDASEMFSGCENLTEAYDAAGKNLINARGMYAGTKKLGTDEIANKFGSVAITDFNSDSKLSKEAVQGSFTGTNVELTDELKGNYSKDWDEAMQTMNKADITSEEKKEVENLNQTLQEHDALFGEINNDMTAQTDGLASSAVVMTEHGSRSTTDVTETNEVSSGSTDGSNLLDRGIVSLGEFWILKKVTGNTLIAGVATFGLQAVGILPTSMKPILNAVTGFVGEDSAIGKALSGIADKLPDSETKEAGETNAEKTLSSVELAQDKQEKDSSDKTNSTVDERVKSDLSSMKVAAQSDKVIDVSNTMEANGKSVARDGVLLTAANKSSNDQEFQDIQAMSMTMAAALEEKAVNMAGESGKLSTDDKETLAAQCMNVMNGMDAYDNGAISQINALYGENTDRATKATQGLGKVMSASTLPFIDAIKEMNAKYDFLSKNDEKALDNMSITGVTKYSDYEVGSINQQTETVTISAEDDMSMYANAGVNDDLETESTVQTPSKSISKNSTVESRTINTSQNMSKTNRVAEVEAKFGHITEQESESEYDLQ